MWRPERRVRQSRGFLFAHGRAPAAALELHPNLPKTRGTLVTFVQRENEAWMAEADLVLDVSRGLMDTIRLDIPPQWSEPFQLDPPLPHEVAPLPGEKRRQLRIHPAAAIKDHFKLRVRGRLTSGVDRLRAPDITAPGIGHLDRYIVLPTQLELQQVEWDTVGLRGAELPSEFAGRLPALDAVAAYQVLGEGFQAALKSVERMAGSPLVRLADIRAAWQTDGQCHGVAAFDIEPSGVGGCLFEAPAHSQLLSASVGGIPAPLEPASANQWRLAFISRQLPQRVEVVFRGTISGSVETGAVRIEAPKIMDLPVERTLWTIHAPAPLGPARILGGPAAQNVAQAELWRMKSAAALLDVAPEVAADQRADEIAIWYPRWQDRLQQSGERIHQEQIRAGARKAIDQEAEARAIEREQASIAERLGAAPATRRAEPDITSDPAELIAAMHVADVPTIFAVAGPRPSGSANLQYAVSAHDGSLRALAALALAGAGFAGMWLMARVHWRTISVASGLMAIGLLWWLMLYPSVLGMTIFVAGGIWRAAKWWRERRQLAAED